MQNFNSKINKFDIIFLKPHNSKCTKKYTMKALNFDRT